MTRLTHLVAGAAFLTLVAVPTATDSSPRRHHSGHEISWRSHGFGDQRFNRGGHHRNHGFRHHRGFSGYRYYYAPRTIRFGFGGYPYAGYYGYPRYYGHGGYGGYGYGYGYGYGGRGYYGYGDPYYGRRYYGYRGYRYRCDDGAAGAIVGGVAGALIGREIDRSDGRNWRRYPHHRGDGTTGLIVGGALGAVVGSAIDRGDC